MTTEQTARQLELAAQILRTGHPFEVRHATSDQWHYSLGVNPAQAVLQDWHIRPVLATPPDNRSLHNPDNLTAEQVGVGYRLLTTEETKTMQSGKEEYWSHRTPKWVNVAYPTQFSRDYTYRLHLSVPWPEPQLDPYAELKKARAEGKVIQWYNGIEWIDHVLPNDENPIWMHQVKDYRIKPEPTFQLPSPPTGMQWLKGEWKSEDLPRLVRARVQAKLDKAAKSLEEALDIARAGGWEQAEGFISGEGIGCCIHVFPGEPDSGHPHAISSEALEWQCGGW